MSSSDATTGRRLTEDWLAVIIGLLIFVALIVALMVPSWLGGRHAVFTSFDLPTHAYLYMLVLVVFGWRIHALKQWLLI